MIGTLLAACTTFSEGLEPPPEPISSAPYTVEFEGEFDAQTRTALLGASRAQSEIGRPPASLFMVRARGRDDIARLEQALRSEGFYDGRVTMRVEPPPPVKEDNGEGPLSRDASARLIFMIETGQRYLFDVRSVEITGERGGYEPPSPEGLDLVAGEPARAAVVLEGERRLLQRAQRRGHALAALGPRKVIVDYDHKTMDVAFALEPGPVVDMGQISFEGVDGIRESLLRRRVPTRPGERFDPDEIADGRTNLIETGLFSSVTVDQPEELDEDGRLPITYRAIQSKHRSIGAGTGYRTDEGPLANIFWEHRNLLGAAERLRVELYGSEIRQELSARFRKPDIGARRQNLLANGSIRREDTDAFLSESVNAGVGVERTFDAGWIGTLGVAYRFVEIEERNEDDTRFALLSLPASFSWDRSDDLLDPTKGWRIVAESAPFVDTLGLGRQFWRSRVTHTRYYRLADKPRLVLALRGNVGTLFGAARRDVPADERFYAGGGGSIRGIPFQAAGPLDNDDDPIGGRSLVEGSTEIRYNVTPAIGVVAFVDTGTVFEESYPDFSEELRTGAGAGLRYATPIGPIRVDIAVPVERDKDVDDPFQVYVSIGQAF